MTLESAILKNIEKLPDSVKQAVFYTQNFSLVTTQITAQKQQTLLQKNQPLAGSMKGTFVLPLPDNFNEPLEDFKNYM